MANNQRTQPPATQRENERTASQPAQLHTNLHELQTHDKQAIRPRSKRKCICVPCRMRASGGPRGDPTTRRRLDEVEEAHGDATVTDRPTDRRTGEERCTGTAHHPHHPRAPPPRAWRPRARTRPLAQRRSDVAWALRQAEGVKRIALEELGAQVGQRVCRLPAHPLWLNGRQIVSTRVVGVHDEEARVARLLVREVDAEHEVGRVGVGR